jgi:hypothetical protein
MKRLINLVLLCAIAIISMAGSCDKPAKRSNDSTKKKEKTVTLPSGETVTMEEYQRSQKKGPDASKYVRQDSGQGGTQYHTTEPTEKKGHTVTLKELSELPPDAKPSNPGAVKIKPLGEKNDIVIPEERDDESDIFKAPRLKKQEIVIDEKVLAAAPPVLQELYRNLMKENRSLRNELSDISSKLDRVEDKIADRNIPVEEPYEVQRTQVMEEIMSYMRQRMIDNHPYPLKDIPKKYLEFYTLEGCRDDVLKEIEVEISEIIRRTAKSMSFKQRYIFDKDKSARRILRLNYDGNLYNHKKK